MPTSRDYKPDNWGPLTGILDTRSLPGEVQPGFWRWRQNFVTTHANRLCRAPGWRKLLGDEVEQYNNQDLHDQLCGDPVGTDNLQQYYDDISPKPEGADDISAYPPASGMCGTTLKTRSTGRQPITLLFPAKSPSGSRRLIAGTQNRLYAFNENKGNWKIIADAWGGSPDTGLPERRWKAAGVGDAVVFTNNFDPPLAWFHDTPTTGCSMQAVSEIESLVELKLTKAGAIGSWKGVLFLGDVEIDGERQEHHVYWSDLNNPTSFIPSNESIAGYQPLSYGEKVFRFVPLGNSLYIYTTLGIWRVNFVSGDQVFEFRQVYSEPEQGARCLAWANTLVNTGKEHIYLGNDGLYVYSQYREAPERVEWAHRSSNTIFDDIDEKRCEAHVAGFKPDTHEYFVSWCKHGEEFPSQTMIFNMEYGSGNYLDHGFTAFLNYISDPRQTIVGWLLDQCICTSSELASDEVQSVMTVDVKEGGVCTGSDTTTCSTVSRTIPFWTSTIELLDGGYYEKMSRAFMSEGSLCSLLGDLTLEDLCVECNNKRLFIMADANDWCLKEYGDAYFRETCTDYRSCGTYRQDGYDSILRSGPLDYRKPTEPKNTRFLELEFEPEIQTIPSLIYCRIGESSHASDSRDGTDGVHGIKWVPLSSKPLAPPSATGGTHEIDGTVPNVTTRWNFWVQNRFLYFELKITGNGGAACFSRLSMDTALRSISNQS